LKLDLPGHLPGQSEDFLGSAFAVGRWVHGAEDVDGHRVPPYPPPTEVLVGNMAVVSGHYNTKYWNALEGAEQEAGELVASYHAVPVNADGDLATWLSQQGATDAIHFAVHGKWSASGGQDGIILVDGTALTSKEIRGITLTNKPFVFLNACQLGQGEKILGDYGGIAKAFLDAGAAGVVAALWNVDDKEAKKLALGFYEQAKSTQVCPAEIFRKLRSSFEKDMHSKLALAYQYFGHPQMRMMLNLP
jgi:CHAT domain-containing protein